MDSVGPPPGSGGYNAGKTQVDYPAQWWCPISGPVDNPYAPPEVASGDSRDAAWYLARVQKYYRWMGYGMLTYLCVAATVAVGQTIVDGPPSLLEIAAGLLAFTFWGTSLGWLFVTMIRVAYVPYDDFPKHYTKARWVGILAGALFFPILAVPAIISVRRLSRFNQLRRLSIDAIHVGESLRDSRESRRDSRS